MRTSPSRGGVLLTLNRTIIVVNRVARIDYLVFSTSGMSDQVVALDDVTYLLRSENSNIQGDAS